MPLYSAEVAHLVGATIASIAPFILAGTTTMRIPFVFLAIFCLIPPYFTAVPALSMECTFTLYRRNVYRLLMPMAFIPLQVSLWIPDTSLHSLSKSGIFDFSLLRINHTYNAS
jgi:hypothetical protein